uniref:Uncharacterized protein n=1 Tax=Glossina palpalis gambiensis TaxID=67801 RepID=A0A1B0BY17_9MUSC
MNPLMVASKSEMCFQCHIYILLRRREIFIRTCDERKENIVIVLYYVISLNFSHWSQRCLVYEIDVWSLNYLITIVYSFSASTSCFYYQPNIMKNTTRFEDFPCKKIQLIFRPIRSLSGAREVVKRIYCVQLVSCPLI